MLQAASEVDSMQKELSQAKVVVEAATQDCNALLDVITVSTADVETKQGVAIAKEEELKVSDSACFAICCSCQNDPLQTCLPACKSNKRMLIIHRHGAHCFPSLFPLPYVPSNLLTACTYADYDWSGCLSNPVNNTPWGGVTGDISRDCCGEGRGGGGPGGSHPCPRRGC